MSAGAAALSDLARGLLNEAVTIALDGCGSLEAYEDSIARTRTLADAAMLAAESGKTELSDSVARIAFEVSREAIAADRRPM